MSKVTLKLSSNDIVRAECILAAKGTESIQSVKIEQVQTLYLTGLFMIFLVQQFVPVFVYLEINLVIIHLGELDLMQLASLFGIMTDSQKMQFALLVHILI